MTAAHARAIAAVMAITGASVAIGALGDGPLRFSVRAALEKGQSYRTRLEPDVRLFFGNQMASVAKRMTTFTANTRSNAVGKSDQEACDIAFISALARLQQHARSEGGDAVIDIKSTYRGENFESASEYLCGPGTFMVGVTLEGTVVKLK